MTAAESKRIARLQVQAREADPNPLPAGSVEPLLCTIRWPKPEGCWYDAAEAEKAIEFIANFQHTQGPLTGDQFILSDEQAWVTKEAFGWKKFNENGIPIRLYRTVYIEEGRGNGKSQWGAGIAGKLLLADGEANPEVVGAAKDRPQARIILNRLKAMLRTYPDASRATIIRVGEIKRRKDEGYYKATSSDVGGAWGGAPHGIIFDEIHAQPNRDLWDALVTGTGKRLQPMVWAFTTAGWDRESLCYELHEFTRQIAEGVVDNWTFLGCVWAAPEDADWTQEEVWRAANPLMGKAFTVEYMKGECDKALAIPAFQNTFRTMYLSQWVGQETRMIPMDHWDACDDPTVVGKRPAFGGLDLSSTTDLSAFVVESYRDGKVDVDVKLYAPAEGVDERAHRDKVPYRLWAEQGLLTLTPGATIDQDYIKADVLKAKEIYDLKDVSYDRWNASKVVKELENEGVVMVQVGQGFAGMSAPTKAMLRLIIDHNMRHGGHPILRWMANNTAPQTDAAENIKPDKAHSTGRIDGITAMVMATSGLTERGAVGPVRRSVYEDRGLMLA